MAAMRSRDAAEDVAVVVEEERASLTKRSDIFFRDDSAGSMMCTSGCGHTGSWMCATSAAGRTIIGMSCVMVVSRSVGGKLAGGGGPLASEDEGKDGAVAGGEEGGLLVVGMLVGGARMAEEREEVTMVRERRGMLSFFVRRMEALVAERAERRARLRWPRGTRRLMTLLAEADWRV